MPKARLQRLRHRIVPFCLFGGGRNNKSDGYLSPPPEVEPKALKEAGGLITGPPQRPGEIAVGTLRYLTEERNRTLGEAHDSVRYGRRVEDGPSRAVMGARDGARAEDKRAPGAVCTTCGRALGLSSRCLACEYPELYWRD